DQSAATGRAGPLSGRVDTGDPLDSRVPRHTPAGGRQAAVPQRRLETRPQPVVGGLTAEGRLRSIGREGVDVVIGDSTNASVVGASRSEGAVQDGLSDVIRPCRGRVIVTCFASNLARLHSLAEIAMDCGRYAGLLGR